MTKSEPKVDPNTASDENTFWICWSVTEVMRILPQDVDEKRTVLQTVDKIMRMSHGDRWKYTAKEYDQYLKGKNPHGLKAPAARATAKRGRKPWPRPPNASG
jgi:hypothetical protein